MYIATLIIGMVQELQIFTTVKHAKQNGFAKIAAYFATKITIQPFN